MGYYLMMDVLLLTVQRDTSQEYLLFLPPVSEQKLCKHVRQLVAVPMSTTDVWCGITLC